MLIINCLFYYYSEIKCKVTKKIKKRKKLLPEKKKVVFLQRQNGNVRT